MENQILLEIARLVSRQSTLLLVMTGMLLVGLVVLGGELYAIMRGLQAIAASLHAVTTSTEHVAQMTAELLRRTPAP